MRNVIIVFANRNHTMQYSSLLKRMGVRNKTINTPRELSESCGISVVILEKDLQMARFVLSKGNFHSFSGMYLITQSNLAQKYHRI